MPPLISIITSTYNRSNVLRYAIESVRQQTLTDWELIVVSDAATDDTPDVVASFADERIRFVELAHNHGEQSVPNNIGLSLARGQFVAFLNHDDLWLPDHLECSYNRLLETGADLVFGVGVLIRSATDIGLVGSLPPEGFRPVNFVPASGWLFRHELVQRVGPWRSYREIWPIPSLDWLMRAYRLTIRFASSEQITWVAITSLVRLRTYEDRLDDEQQALFEQIQQGTFREQFVQQVLLQHHQQQLQYPIRSLLVQAGRHCLNRLLALSDYRLMPLWFMMKFWRKGGVIHYLRKKRGLHSLKPITTNKTVSYYERLAT
ncbi:MAG: glycosyltransferase family 2 protein [Cytophagales bacterium]|nr:MAG: glycosyltransferase family 2 protein [Cytophagales bacterium]